MINNWYAQDLKIRERCWKLDRIIWFVVLSEKSFILNISATWHSLSVFFSIFIPSISLVGATNNEERQNETKFGYKQKSLEEKSDLITHSESNLEWHRLESESEWRPDILNLRFVFSWLHLFLSAPRTLFFNINLKLDK